MNAPGIAWISGDDPPDAFPPLDSACEEPDGLLAAGGDLSAERLLYAYEHGIFPWYEEGQPILWWLPDPRCVLIPADFHASRRLCRTLPKAQFQVSFNAAFDPVIDGCAGARYGEPGTWITTDIRQSYRQLHRLGWAHSVEVWQDGQLAGGLYGIAIGKAFFGESMFSARSDASKVALLALCQLLVKQDFAVLDCQVASPHLTTLGALLMPRAKFADLLRHACHPATRAEFWPDRRTCATEFLPLRK